MACLNCSLFGLGRFGELIDSKSLIYKSPALPNFRLMTKAETLEQNISKIADKISEANSKGIADGFSHAQLGIKNIRRSSNWNII